MAEANTAEVEAKVDAAFGAAFGGTPPAEIPPVKVADEPAPEPAKPVSPAPAPVPKPEYIRVTKQDWDNTRAATGKVANLESQLAKLTGSIPKAEMIVQQVIDKVQAQTPAGAPVELTDEDFAEFQETFPEVGATMRKSLDKIVKRLNVRGTASPATPAPAVDVDAAVEKVLTAREMTALTKAHPDWQDTVARVDRSKGEAPPEDNPFRKWLGTQSAEYQEEVNETHSPAVIQAAIDRFKAIPKTDAPARPDKGAARRAVLADAVTPRAEGNPPPLNPPQTADDAFTAGFRSVKRH